jgi:hypothetical protein
VKQLFCFLVTLKFAASRQTCRLAHVRFCLKIWAFENDDVYVQKLFFSISPPPVKFSRGDRLCPVFVDVSPERETWPHCTYPGACSFQHDVDKVPGAPFFQTKIDYLASIQ